MYDTRTKTLLEIHFTYSGNQDIYASF